MTTLPPAEPFEIAVRAYAPPPPTKRKATKSGEPRWRPPAPSAWTLTWDTEFSVDAAQQLRVGTYQIRDAGEPVEAGLFYDPLSLSDRDRDVVYRYGLDHDLAVRDVGSFVEDVFLRVLVDWNGTCILFNAPGDLAKLAIRHATTPGPEMRGGFTFIVSENPYRPRVQVRHLNSAESFIRLTYPAIQPTPRGMRRRGLAVPRSRGAFVDVRTIAAALLEHRGDLKSLAELLDTPTRKGTADYADPSITPAFLDYAMTDVQVTWECYERLAARYASLGLETPLPRIYSAARLGKAQLDAMGVRPWSASVKEYPPKFCGQVMSAYYGGRSEIHLRRAS